MLVDIAVFLIFVAGVITIGIVKSRHEKTGEDYFLAGRSLFWWLIGFSLIAANISTEQYVGMSGNAASHIGLAIASYEWIAAITLVVVAFGFLPYFLRAGIYTVPEFLEYRYNSTARTIMAVATIFIYMLLVGAVTYSGALTIRTLGADMGLDVSLWVGSLIIGIIAMVYVVAGGLKACAWADLLQGSALIIGGILIMVFAFVKLGGVEQAATIENVATGEVTVKSLDSDAGAFERFWDLNKERMNMFLPASDSTLPWTALLIGLWIPNFYYWGLNQYITQRVLGSASLKEGQKGIVFAAFLKIVVPFAIVVPGIIAFNLFSDDMARAAVKDNSSTVIQYYKANPETDYVSVVRGPSEQELASAPKGKYLIAVYPDEAAVEQIEVKNPGVVAVSQGQFSSVVPPEHIVFGKADSSWDDVFPGLAREVEQYNQAERAAADSAGVKPRRERFIAYKYDTAMPHLLSKVLPRGVGVRGFILAALLGAVVSSLAAMLNAASTIFTMDVFKKFIKPDASQKAIVLLGRGCVVVFSVIAVMLAPKLGDPKLSNSIFTIIQGSQGLISPGILAVFVFGLLIRKGPGSAGVAGLLTNVVAYGGMWIASRTPAIMEIGFFNSLFNNFLNRMAISFFLCLLVMAVITLLNPLKEPVVFEQRGNVELTYSKGAFIGGILVIIITISLYIIFSPIGVAG